MFCVLALRNTNLFASLFKDNQGKQVPEKTLSYSLSVFVGII